MTEKMFQDAKKDFEKSLAKCKENFEKRLKNSFDYLHKKTTDGLLRSFDDVTHELINDFEDAIRDNVPVTNLPPANFPMGLIHDDDYYGMDNEELPKKSKNDSSGWDGEC